MKSTIALQDLVEELKDILTNDIISLRDTDKKYLIKGLTRVKTFIDEVFNDMCNMNVKSLPQREFFTSELIATIKSDISTQLSFGTKHTVMGLMRAEGIVKLKLIHFM